MKHIIFSCVLCFTVILGNAFLSLFFTANQSQKILQQCLGAYQQAVSLKPFLYRFWNEVVIYR